MRGELVRRICVLSACLAACGESSGGGSVGSHLDAGTGGHGAAPGSGGASSGGVGAGPGGNSGASGNPAATGAHCSPGTFLEDPIDTYATRNVVACYGYPSSDGGIPVSDAPGIRSIKLPGPMTVGHEYSMSIEIVATDAPNTELWGSASECGFGDELLWSGRMPEGVFCATLHPTKPSSYLLFVARAGGAQHRSITLCPGVACPK